MEIHFLKSQKCDDVISGYASIEYMPESHSIILNEYDEDLPKEINPSNFTIGEFVKKRFRGDF